MMSPPDPESSKASLMSVEVGLTLLAAAIAFGWPTIGNGFFSRIEKALGKLARRQGLAVAVTGFAALFLRLAILPFCPIPHPFIPDDFSFLLAANTFASGRLTNPTPAMWVHFETLHVSMQPTYMSMYFPAQGLLMAASKVVLGHPWYGVVCMSALMCAAICWMLQAWLPPGWALLGGAIAILHIGLFSYWVNTYTGGGLIAACGGALVLGAFPRLMKHPRLRYTLLMALGIILLVTSRPYEGFLLCLPVAFVLARWVFVGKNKPAPAALLRLSAAPLALVIAAGAWFGYYNYRAFGSPLTLPYTVNRNTYAITPYFVWQSPRPEPVYHHEVMRNFYHDNEFVGFEQIHSVSGFFHQSVLKVVKCLLFFCGIALLPPLLMSWRVLSDRRTRFLLQCAAVMAVGMAVQIFLLPHYLAPFTVILYALGLQAMRHLRQLRADGRPFGLGWVRLIVTVCVLLAVVRLFVGPLQLGTPEWPASYWAFTWSGPAEFGKARAGIQAELEKLPGKQLVLVRYSPKHILLDEWVYNEPEIDASKVIWAREMDAADNLELIQHYPDRQVWLVQPDSNPADISPYPTPGQALATRTETPDGQPDLEP